MKQMKFFLLALMAIFMSVSITSCLKGDDNNMMVVYNSFVRVNTYDIPVSFKDNYEVKLAPTQLVTNTDNKEMALISYQYDRTKVDPNSKSLTITLLADPYFFREYYVSSSTPVPEEGKAPIMTLEPTTPNGTLIGGFYDANTLILPVTFKYKKYDTEDKHKIEIGLHKFVMTYDNDNGFMNGVLTLTFHQTIAEEEGVTERIDNVVDYQAYNISSILREISGTVTKVKVVVMENQKDDKMSDAKVKTYEYAYNFKK